MAVLFEVEKAAKETFDGKALKDMNNALADLSKGLGTCDANTYLPPYSYIDRLLNKRRKKTLLDFNKTIVHREKPNISRLERELKGEINFKDIVIAYIEDQLKASCGCKVA